MNKKWTSTSSTSCKMPSIQEHNENFHICRTHATYSASLSTTQCLSHTHRPSHQSDGMWCHNPNHNCHTNISILQQYQPYLSCNLKKKYIFTKQFNTDNYLNYWSFHCYLPLLLWQLESHIMCCWFIICDLKRLNYHMHTHSTCTHGMSRSILLLSRPAFP